MNIKIITIHNIPNFGSVFQAYALQVYLKNLGHNVEIIDYNPAYYLSNSLRSRIGRAINYSANKQRMRKFLEFIKKNLVLTDKCYTTLNGLKGAHFEADLFIAGGDQLWNTYYACGKDDAYKLSFVNGKKVSYATSMGRNTYESTELEELAFKLRDFSAVSVRESSSVLLLKSVGIPVQQCVDPVLLFSAKEYRKFVHKPPIDRYLLVYLVTPSPLLEETIRYVSSKLGVKIVLCSGFSKKCTCDYFIKDLGPDEILSYIVHADFVVSASFHATVFSILFEKRFVALLPDENTNERITDLLCIYGLSKRIINNSTQLNNILEKIDYSEIVKTIQKSRKHSIEYLNDVISKTSLGNKNET